MIVSLALFLHLASACAAGISPQTLAAIAKSESGFDTLALYDNTTRAVLHPHDMPQAITLARQKIALGHSVDLGLMQINSRNLAPLHLSIAQAFEPCRNLRAGATLLAEDYGGGKTPAEKQAALFAAFSRYNTGTATDGFRNGYVTKILTNGGKIVRASTPRTPPKR